MFYLLFHFLTLRFLNYFEAYHCDLLVKFFLLIICYFSLYFVNYFWNHPFLYLFITFLSIILYFFIIHFMKFSFNHHYDFQLFFILIPQSIEWYLFLFYFSNHWISFRLFIKFILYLIKVNFFYHSLLISNFIQCYFLKFLIF